MLEVCVSHYYEEEIYVTRLSKPPTDRVWPASGVPETDERVVAWKEYYESKKKPAQQEP